MPSITVTFTDVTKGPYSLAQLFSGVSLTGVTVAPTDPPKAPRIADFVSVQGDPGNTTNLIYTGDQNLPPTGAAIGMSLAAGAVDVRQMCSTPLAGVYVQASANSAKANITALGGFQ